MKTIAIIIGALIVAALIWRRLRDDGPHDDAGEAIEAETRRLRASTDRQQAVIDAHTKPADGASPGPKQKE